MAEQVKEDPATTGHERFAGDETDDGFGQSDPSPTAAYSGPPVIGRETGNEIRTQRPEEEEFGLRATQSGDPDKDRPNGDPHTVGHPVGGGERGPDVGGRGGDPDEQATDRG